MSLTTAIRQKQMRNARKLLKNSSLAMHVGSVAIAIEALEALLVQRQILNPDELMEKIKILTEEHYAKGNFIAPSED